MCRHITCDVTCTAKDVAKLKKLLSQQVFSGFWVLETLTSTYGDPRFTARLFKDWAESLGVNQCPLPRQTYVQAD